MGKAVGLLGIAAVALWASAAHAVYTTNPGGRWEKYRFHLAVDSQYMRKDIDLKTRRTPVDESIYGFFLRPSFSIAPNVTIYGRLGMQDSDITEIGFAAGAGLQAAYPIPAAPDWAVGISFDFLYVADSDFTGAEGSREWMEYQIAPGFSYNIPKARSLTPYAAMLVDLVDIDRFKGAGDPAGGMQEDDRYGLAVGFNFDPRPNWRIDLQFRAISETAASLSVGYTF